MAWQAVSAVHAVEFDIDGLVDGEGRVVCGSSEGIVNVALCIPFAEKVYLAVRRKYFSENMPRRPGAVLDCILASCSPDERSIEMQKYAGV